MFITALHALSDEPIRDRIVFILKDSKLSEELRLDPDPVSRKQLIGHVKAKALKNDFKESTDMKGDGIAVNAKGFPNQKRT